MKELEQSVSARELGEWRAFYSIDPWGEQRADMRAARIAAVSLMPHVKPGTNIDANDYMLFPDDVHDLPDDVTAEERKMMQRLNRIMDD